MTAVTAASKQLMMTTFRSRSMIFSMKEAEQGLPEVSPDKAVDGEVDGGIQHE